MVRKAIADPQKVIRKRSTKDILDMMSSFQKSLDEKPPLPKMYQEVQMMKFKVRPIQGDLSAVNLQNKKFIETLWSLGKLEEFFQKEYGRLTAKNRDLFKRVFESIYEKYQGELNKVDLHWEKQPSQNDFLEVEIFKDRLIKKN